MNNLVFFLQEIEAWSVNITVIVILKLTPAVQRTRSVNDNRTSVGYGNVHPALKHS